MYPDRTTALYLNADDWKNGVEGWSNTSFGTSSIKDGNLHFVNDGATAICRVNKNISGWASKIFKCRMKTNYSSSGNIVIYTWNGTAYVTTLLQTGFSKDTWYDLSCIIPDDQTVYFSIVTPGTDTTQELDFEYIYVNNGILHEGIQLYLLSPTKERLGILSDDNESGKILSLTVNEISQGGLDTFSFQIARDNDLPISRNTEILVYIDGVASFTGFISSLPEPDQDDPVLEVEGQGFYHRLDEKIINYSYTSHTLGYILNNLLSNELDYDIGIDYDSSLIDLPSISDITIEFSDITLLEAIEQILEIANYDYTNTKYRYWIDLDKKFNVGTWGDSLLKTLFEGFQYQSPEVEIDSSRIKNKILCYRTLEDDDDTMEYVTTIEDTDSQDEEGIFEQKLAIPAYLDTETLTKMATAIIAQNNEPQKTITIDNLVITEPLEFGLYGLANRRQEYWVIINSCNSLSGWSTVGLSSATLTMSTDHVLTGRQALKCQVNDSEEEYFEYTLDNPIPLPQMLRAYVYFDSGVIQFKVEFFDRNNNGTTIYLGYRDVSLQVDSDSLSDQDLIVDSYGEEVEVEASTVTDVAINQWMILEQEVGSESTEDTVRANLTVDEDDDLYLNLSETEEEIMEVRTSANASISDVSRVRITILATGAGAFYLDRLDTYANTYNRADLLLKEAEYILSSTGRFLKAKFGEAIDSLVDEIEDEVSDGDTALAVFAKQ